jgi:phage gp36-like protein
MGYATQADIELQLPEQDLIDLTDDDATGLVNADIIARAIADADAEIDSHLSVRYALPLSEPYPDLVRRISVTLSICWLWGRRAVLTVPQTWQERCESARKYLEWLALGKYALDVPDVGKVSGGGPKATKKKADRIYTMERPSTGCVGTLDNY